MPRAGDDAVDHAAFAERAVLVLTDIRERGDLAVVLENGDTLAGNRGDFRALHIRVWSSNGGSPRIEREDTHYAQWYVSGSLADTLRREFCFKRRARDGGSCMRFQLDTLADGRRRLRMLGYVSQVHPRVWVLTERLP